MFSHFSVTDLRSHLSQKLERTACFKVERSSCGESPSLDVTAKIVRSVSTAKAQKQHIVEAF